MTAPARAYWPATLASALLTAGLLSTLNASPRPAQVPPPAPATRAAAPAPEPSPSATAGAPTPLRAPAVALPSVTTAPTPSPSPTPEPTPTGVPEPWRSLAECESGLDWTEGDGGLGPFRGGLQWHPDTWAAVKPPDAPDDPAEATRWQEVAAGERLMAEPWGGWHHWPVCSREVGLR